MNKNKICSLGYFDRVIIDGYSMPMFSTKGIEIKGGDGFVDSINDSLQSFTHGVGKLRITIYGESTFNLEDDNLLGMRWHREQELKLSRTKVDKNDRYAIAYVDILIFKSEFSFPERVINRGKSIDDLNKLAKSEDELMLLSKAMDMQRNIWHESGGTADCTIAIIDRVYVSKHFRKCGISKWVHMNIFDIIRTYGMVSASAVLLIPGDFNNEAEQIFSLSKKDYTDMLINHYKNTGYKFIDKFIMCKYPYVKKGILSIYK